MTTVIHSIVRAPSLRQSRQAQVQPCNAGGHSWEYLEIWANDLFQWKTLHWHILPSLNKQAAISSQTDNHARVCWMHRVGGLSLHRSKPHPSWFFHLKKFPMVCEWSFHKIHLCQESLKNLQNIFPIQSQHNWMIHKKIHHAFQSSPVLKRAKKSFQKMFPIQSHYTCKSSPMPRELLLPTSYAQHSSQEGHKLQVILKERRN